ncbi:threonine transporter RhtB [Psychromonas marina]|uniref:Threonine transporter RhtB n=1 Tax=Psychromonas marina TaxID=88364 RepID=A0ABQ6E203_9GAMM|nr:LysE family translocator [Psychromonas marina]GLS91362.1 threonine transporter RhtB [Psychromonas marina]
MIPIETIAMFIVASAALSLSPGPDNIFVLTQSAMKGRKAGIFVTLGLCTGLMFHTAMVSLGIAAIFQTSELAFNTLKIIGALYLLYLAWQAFRSSAANFETVNDDLLDWKALYLRGIIMNITNPKVAIFFLAFLPQFADPSVGSITLQMILFGCLFIITTLVIFSSVAWSAGFLGEWLKSSEKSQSIINKMAGTVFVGLAIKLAVTSR